MTKAELEQEYNKLVTFVGVAVFNRVLWLGNEIQKANAKEREAECPKTPNESAPDTK